MLNNECKIPLERSEVMGGNAAINQEKEFKMKSRSKITKVIAIGLFAVALLLDVSLTVDSGNSQNTDLSLGSLKVSLFQKAYACGGGVTCPYWPYEKCYIRSANFWVLNAKPWILDH